MAEPRNLTGGYTLVEEDIPLKSLSEWELLRLCIVMLGVQFTWTVEFAYGTPLLLGLGLAPTWLALVWTAGPISGLVMQPFVGAWSDRCSGNSWGRRRPFLISGCIGVIFALVLLSQCRELAHLLFFTDELSSKVQSLAIGIAIISFWLIDFTLNMMTCAARALVYDCTTVTDQIHSGNVHLSFMIGLGNIIGYLLGFTNLVVPAFAPFLQTQVKAMTLLNAILIIITTFITCVSVQEYAVNEALTEFEPALKTVQQVFKDIFQAFRSKPSLVRKVCHVQFFTWLAWFPYMFYASSWISSLFNDISPPQETLPQPVTPRPVSFSFHFLLPSVAHDDMDMGANDGSVRIGSLALLLFSVVAFIVNLFLSRLIAQLGIRKVYQWALLQLGLLLLMAYFVHSVLFAMILVSFCGFSWAVTLTVPFTLVGLAVERLEDEKILSASPVHPTPTLPERQRSQSTEPTIENFSRPLVQRLRRAAVSEMDLTSLSRRLFHSTRDLTLQPAMPIYTTTIPTVRSHLQPRFLHSPHHTWHAETGRQLLEFALDLENVSARTRNLDQENVTTPWTIGVAMGLLNVYVALPQLLVSILSSLLFQWMSMMESSTEEAVRILFVLGGLCSWIACFLAFRIQESEVA